MRAAARAFGITKGFAIGAALGMRLEMKKRDDVVGGHGTTTGPRNGLGAPRAIMALNPAATPCASASASCLWPMKAAPVASATLQACLPLRSIPCSANQGSALE